MYQKIRILLIPLLLIGAVAGFAYPAAADSQSSETLPQVVYQTPTARPDGQVVYVVQPGDTCLRIQLLTNVTVDQLRALNKLDDGCTLREGQELLLAVITPEATPTQNPKVTPTALLPTPTPFKGNGKICVQLFNDVNGNGTQDTGEYLMDGGAVSITNRLGNVSETGYTTADFEPMCKEVPEGEYNISVAIPSGYNATTSLNKQALKLSAGDQQYLVFGAQKSSLVVEDQPVETPSGNNLFLAIFGGVLVLGGIGLGGYVAFSRRK